MYISVVGVDIILINIILLYSIFSRLKEFMSIWGINNVVFIVQEDIKDIHLKCVPFSHETSFLGVKSGQTRGNWGREIWSEGFTSRFSHLFFTSSPNTVHLMRQKFNKPLSLLLIGIVCIWSLWKKVNEPIMTLTDLFEKL